MGAHHSHQPDGQQRERRHNSRQGSGLTMSPSSGDLQQQGQQGQQEVPAPAEKLAPVDKLAKALAKKAHDEEGVNGVTERSFARHLFPKYPELAGRLFRHLLAQSKAKANHIPASPFRLQCERFLGMLDDAAIVQVYVEMFCESSSEQMMTPDNLKTLLLTCYNLSMDHYTEGPKSCFMIHHTLKAVVDSCFYKKTILSANYVARWLDENCHRLVLPMHRYCVHVLSTAWRHVDGERASESGGLELATPVLETPPVGFSQATRTMPISQAWLLAGSLPPVYSRPNNIVGAGGSSSNLASAQFLSRLVCLLPSHWTLLYASHEHGLGANRFLHHVLAYKGPTLVLLHGGKIDNQGVADQLNEKLTLCIASAVEWRESHLYAGGPESALLQLQPKFSLIEKGAKMLYLNTHIRGYPKGLRAGSDTRKPTVAVDEGFDKFEYRGIRYPLDAMEVWGCGDPANRETQLDIKKWQVKEAERQRQVKLSAADWIDHPDRYLLELAGRPQYNSTAS